MKYIYLWMFLLAANSTVNANTIIIDFSTPGYIFNKQELQSSEKKTILINGLSYMALSTKNNLAIRPLLVFQIFDYTVDTTCKKIMKAQGKSFTQWKDFVTPLLEKDMLCDISNLTSPSAFITTSFILDSLVLKEGHTYTLYTGIVKLDFFNVIEYEQFHPLQVNQTIFNLKALTPSVYAWLTDSIPVFNADYIDKKVFLLKKEGNDYFFYRYPERDDHEITSFPTRFVYRKEYGVISVKTKYLLSEFSVKNRKVIVASAKYFDF